MKAPADIDALSPGELRSVAIELFERVGELSGIVIELRDEIARLKGLKGRPDIKPPSVPSGMEKASRPPSSGPGKRRGGGPKTARRTIHEDRKIEAVVPEGSRFKGYEDFVVQDLVLRPHVTRYRRERSLTPDGRSVLAPLPEGVGGALMEELAVDKRYGFFVNHDLASYEVPVHADIPHQEVIFMDETDPMSSPMKAKGIGELGLCGVGAAIANAIHNATGIRVRDYPITLDKLLEHMPETV